MRRGWLFVCPRDSESQIGFVLTTRHGNQESAWRLNLEADACQSAAWERKIQEHQFFFFNLDMENFNSIFLP